MLRKKSFISLLLTFAMVIALFVPFATTAFADDIDVPAAEAIEPADEPEAGEPEDNPGDFVVSSAVVYDETLAPPVADVVLPPAQPWRNPAFAGDPSGFRPDRVPDSVSLSAPNGAVIFYKKEVVTIPSENVYLNSVRRAAGPTQEQIDAVPAPELLLENLYTGPISLADIDAEKAVIIKAITYKTAGGEAYSDVATYIYYQRVWVLTDVFIDGYGNPNDNTLKNPTPWTNFILDQVVNEMTQSELALMTGGSVNGQLANEMPHPYGPYSIGTINSVANQYGRSDVRLTSATIGTDFGISRLCIPTTIMTDGPAGLRNGRTATAWVVATALASSWDRDVQYAFASRVAEELAWVGFDMMLAPAFNIHRSPMGGRNFEYYSEDPYVSYVNALVYTDALLEKRVGVSLKHYMANDQENNRNNLSSTVSERALREVMGYPFMRVVEESDPYALMSIYGIVNQTRASDHHWMMDQLPREQWGFQGYVQTDWGNHWDAHSMSARLNQHQPTNNHTNGNQFVNFENGRDETDGLSSDETRDIRMAMLRRNSRDILVSKIKMPVFNGLYDDLDATVTQARQTNWYTDPDGPYTESAKLNRDLTAKTQILLKNEQINGVPVLPLIGANKQRISLIYSGIMASANTNQLQHNTDYIVQGGGSGQVNWTKDPDRAPTIGQALERAGYTLVNYVRDSTMYTLSGAGTTASPFASSVSTAQLDAMKANAANYAANSDVGIYIISRASGEGSDPNMANFSALLGEKSILETFHTAFKAVNKPFIVITNMGGNIDTTEIRKYSDAILHISAAGEVGGLATADVLSGAVNPSGKTVDSWPLTFADTVPVLAYDFFKDKIDPSIAGHTWGRTASYVTAVYVEDVLTGYKFFETAEALDPDFDVDDHLAFPFGFGLSYTTFEYSNLRLNKETFSITDNTDTITATVTVTNTGDVPGRTAVQMYLSASSWKQEFRPLRDLRNFDMTKVLAPGESQDISFVIEKRDLCWFDDGKRMEDGMSWRPWNLKMNGTSDNATVIPSSDPVFAAYANTQMTSFNATTGVRVDYSNPAHVNTNLTRGVSEELNTWGYTRTHYNGVEAYTTYNGFYGENGHKTGWRVDRGTVFTVQIGDSSRTPDLEARGVSAKFSYGEHGDIAAPKIWNSDDGTELSYDISVGQTFDTNLITVTAKFDADRLVYANSKSAAGFTILSDAFNASTGEYTAKIAIMQAGTVFSAADLTKILTVNFDAKPSIKHDDVVEGVLISLDISKPQSISTVTARSYVNVFTLIENWMRWTDENGKVNDAVLSYIINNYYLAREGDHNWEQAKIYDADKNGIINMDDILIILTFYN